MMIAWVVASVAMLGYLVLTTWFLVRRLKRHQQRLLADVAPRRYRIGFHELKGPNEVWCVYDDPREAAEAVAALNSLYDPLRHFWLMPEEHGAPAVDPARQPQRIAPVYRKAAVTKPIGRPAVFMEQRSNGWFIVSRNWEIGFSGPDAHEQARAALADTQSRRR